MLCNLCRCFTQPDHKGYSKTAFYVRVSTEKCGCASGACSRRAGSSSYNSYGDPSAVDVPTPAPTPCEESSMCLAFGLVDRWGFNIGGASAFAELLCSRARCVAQLRPAIFIPAECVLCNPVTGFFFFLIPLIMYFVECKKSTTLSYLNNMIRDPRKLSAYIASLNSHTPPCLTYHVRCWHTTSDGDGGSHTVVPVEIPQNTFEFLQIERAAVHSYGLGSSFLPSALQSRDRTHRSDHAVAVARFSHCGDFANRTAAEIEGAVARWGAASACLVTIDSTWTVSDGDGSLDPVKKDLYHRHKNLDRSCEVKLGKTHPPQFKKSQSMLTRELPVFISAKAFWVASFMMLTVPFRMVFERYTGSLKINFFKKAHGCALRNVPRQAHVQTAQQNRNQLTELGKLAQLHQSGALTDAEFSAAKKRILGI